MFEKKFLAYILYTTLLEIRERAYETNDSRTYHQTDILHNIPFSLIAEEPAKEEFNTLIAAVETLEINEWLDARMGEFKNRFPEFQLYLV
jgi:hypothetical protein